MESPRDPHDPFMRSAESDCFHNNKTLFVFTVVFLTSVQWGFSRGCITDELQQIELSKFEQSSVKEMHQNIKHATPLTKCICKVHLF